jgi:glycosyltransferase involved in cell wall biosynthesis
LNGFWDFILRPPFGQSTAGLDDMPLTVNWFIPPASENSGGHINLFRFAQGLQERGINCRVVVTNDGTLSPRVPDEILRSDITRWFGSFNSGISYMDGDLPPAHVSVATGWQTAYGVRAFRGSPLKYYFIQDFEPWFYARSSESLFAEQTYSFGFTGVTAGRWLAHLMSENYGMPAHALGFSYDRNLYKPMTRRPDGVRRLFYYARPETPRRGWEVANLTIKRIHALRPDIQFVLAGGHVPAGSFDFPVFAPGALPVRELADLYSQCDCALVLSFSNLSLLPLELMACGVPVIANRGPNVEWLLNNEIAYLSEPQPDALASKVVEVMSLPSEEYAGARARALAFAEATDWEREIDRLADIIRRDAARLQPRPKVVSTLGAMPLPKAQRSFRVAAA